MILTVRSGENSPLLIYLWLRRCAEQGVMGSAAFGAMRLRKKTRWNDGIAVRTVFGRAARSTIVRRLRVLGLRVRDSDNGSTANAGIGVSRSIDAKVTSAVFIASAIVTSMSM